MTAQERAPLWDALLTVGRPPRGRRASHAAARPRLTSRGMSEALVITVGAGLSIGLVVAVGALIIGGIS